MQLCYWIMHGIVVIAALSLGHLAGLSDSVATPPRRDRSGAVPENSEAQMYPGASQQEVQGGTPVVKCPASQVALVVSTTLEYPVLDAIKADIGHKLSALFRSTARAKQRDQIWNVTKLLVRESASNYASAAIDGMATQLDVIPGDWNSPGAVNRLVVFFQVNEMVSLNAWAGTDCTEYDADDGSRPTLTCRMKAPPTITRRPVAGDRLASEYLSLPDTLSTLAPQGGLDSENSNFSFIPVVSLCNPQQALPASNSPAGDDVPGWVTDFNVTSLCHRCINRSPHRKGFWTLRNLVIACGCAAAGVIIAAGIIIRKVRRRGSPPPEAAHLLHRGGNEADGYQSGIGSDSDSDSQDTMPGPAKKLKKRRHSAGEVRDRPLRNMAPLTTSPEDVPRAPGAEEPGTIAAAAAAAADHIPEEVPDKVQRVCLHMDWHIEDLLESKIITEEQYSAVIAQRHCHGTRAGLHLMSELIKSDNNVKLLVKMARELSAYDTTTDFSDSQSVSSTALHHHLESLEQNRAKSTTPILQRLSSVKASPQLDSRKSSAATQAKAKKICMRMDFFLEELVTMKIISVDQFAWIFDLRSAQGSREALERLFKVVKKNDRLDALIQLRKEGSFPGVTPDTTPGATPGATPDIEAMARGGRHGAYSPIPRPPSALSLGQHRPMSPLVTVKEAGQSPQELRKQRASSLL